ncbi:hypothetical protein [Noviherbaspirillum sp. ST9]|uniref:hypothetical protein n=1 Tax=Noviherbaspirillum sp. ST9 TaxID=3401606 RepID=UPI003B587219
MDTDIAKLDAVEARLREVIKRIVRRHAASGRALSWSLMFDIEEEALALLNADPALDARFVRMMIAPPTAAARPAEGPVDMMHVDAMRTVLWMIQEAYYHGA